MKTLTLCAVLVAADRVLVVRPAGAAAGADRRRGDGGSTSITLAEVDEKALQQPAGELRQRQAVAGALRGAARRARRDRRDRADGRGGEGAGHRPRRAGREGNHLQGRRRSPSRTSPPGIRPTRRGCRARRSIRCGSRSAAFLTQERMQTARDQYIDALKSKTTVLMMLDPPRQTVKMPAKSPDARSGRRADRDRRVFRLPVSVLSARRSGASSRCSTPTAIASVSSTASIPLPNHPNAGRRPKRRLCANEQGKFWPYHDRLFANQQRLGEQRPQAARRRIWASTPRSSTRASTRTSTRTIVEADMQRRQTRPASTARRPSSSTAACSAGRSRSRRSSGSSTTNST